LCTQNNKSVTVIKYVQQDTEGKVALTASSPVKPNNTDKLEWHDEHYKCQLKSTEYI